MKENAYAKINLTLEITGKRPDGFHNIKSIFQEISLYDEIDVEKYNSSDIKFIPPIDTEKNSVRKALDLFFKNTGIRDRAKVNIKKAIPVKTGLGGGSSDAATTLILLNKLFNHSLERFTLLEIGEEIGADVPFFFHKGTALVEGRGEKVYPITPIKKLYILLVIPDFSVSTKDAYMQIDRFKQGKTNYTEKLLSILEKKEYDLKAIKAYLYNGFEEMYKKQDKKFEFLFENLKSNTGEKFHLTGSGSAVFTLFEDKTTVEKIQNTLKMHNLRTILAETR